MPENRQNILQQIRNGNHQPILDIYTLYRNNFIQWAVTHYSVDEDEAKDVFQEVILAFYENVKEGTLLILESDLKTYLFAIGKHKLFNLIKKSSRSSNFSEVELINDKFFNLNSVEMEHNEEYNKKTVIKYLSKLPDDSQKILELYYLKGYDMESIAREMGCSVNAAKKRKFDSLKALAKMIKGTAKILIAAAALLSCF